MDRRQAQSLRRRGLAAFTACLIFINAACVPWVPLSAAGQELPTTAPTQTATLIPPSATPTPLPPTETPTPTPEPGCTDKEGILHDLAIPSKAVGQDVPFILYTPPCFDPSGATRYPVVYLLHGQSYKQDQWVRLGMPAAADRLITAGELPPFLMVMPNEYFNLSNPFEKGFDQALINELLPWVDASYPTCADRTCRVIAGLSRGGSWALYLGVAHMDLFGAIGAHSTAPFFGMAGYLSHFLRQFGRENFPRLYIDFGENDSLLPYMVDFKKSLDGYKLLYEYHLQSGNHTEEYWSSHVEEYLRWYWEDWAPPGS